MQDILQALLVPQHKITMAWDSVDFAYFLIRHHVVTAAVIERGREELRTLRVHYSQNLMQATQEES